MPEKKNASVPLEGALILEDGRTFLGTLFGAQVSVDLIQRKSQKKSQKKSMTQNLTQPTEASDFGYGEVVFNTSMAGYQEILTDPSYYGQIICMTTPHIGNTGINSLDAESARPFCSGLVVHENSAVASSWRSEEELDHFLSRTQIPAIHGVDTRALTRHLRSQGVLRGLILPKQELPRAQELLAKLPRFEGRDFLSAVSTQQAYFWSSKGPLIQHRAEHQAQHQAKYRVVALDFGIKWNLLRSLEKLDCSIEVVPASTPASAILARKPDGILLSNGPGDPCAAPYAVNTVKALLGKIPIFGVCMGHQILALALGAKTYKLKFGHRGGNQPVLAKSTGKVEISSHNHGYSVDASSLPPQVTITYLNLNDQTVEGIAVPELNAFSVQYHPEACPGPHDSSGLFQQFIDNMSKNVPKIS
jgi:carbamoyl-phosphate synthase small subunit